MSSLMLLKAKNERTPTKFVFIWQGQKQFYPFWGPTKISKILEFRFFFLTIVIEVATFRKQILVFKVSVGFIIFENECGPQRFFWMELIKVYLIGSNVPVFENSKKWYGYNCKKASFYTFSRALVSNILNKKIFVTKLGRTCIFA